MKKYVKTNIFLNCFTNPKKRFMLAFNIKSLIKKIDGLVNNSEKSSKKKKKRKHIPWGYPMSNIWAFGDVVKTFYEKVS